MSTSAEAVASTPDLASFKDVKTVDAKMLLKKVSITAESEVVKTPELEGLKANLAVTTAVKTPCFISYVDSTSNTPSSDAASTPSTCNGSPTVEVEGVNKGTAEGSPNDSTIGVFRTIATPATVKKVRKVKAKGVTLFDEAEFRGEKLVMEESGEDKSKEEVVGVSTLVLAAVLSYIIIVIVGGVTAAARTGVVSSTSALVESPSKIVRDRVVLAGKAAGVTGKALNVFVDVAVQKAVPVVFTMHQCLKAGLSLQGAELEEILLSM